MSEVPGFDGPERPFVHVTATLEDGRRWHLHCADVPNTDTVMDRLEDAEERMRAMIAATTGQTTEGVALALLLRIPVPTSFDGTMWVAIAPALGGVVATAQCFGDLQRTTVEAVRTRFGRKLGAVAVWLDPHPLVLDWCATAQCAVAAVDGWPSVSVHAPTAHGALMAAMSELVKAADDKAISALFTERLSDVDGTAVSPREWAAQVLAAADDLDARDAPITSSECDSPGGVWEASINRRRHDGGRHDDTPDGTVDMDGAAGLGGVHRNQGVLGQMGLELVYVLITRGNQGRSRLAEAINVDPHGAVADALEKGLHLDMDGPTRAAIEDVLRLARRGRSLMDTLAELPDTPDDDVFEPPADRPMRTTGDALAGETWRAYRAVAHEYADALRRLAAVDASDATDHPTSPREVLRDRFMTPRGPTVAALADLTGIPHERLAGILDGTIRIDPTDSAKLAEAFATPPQYWLTILHQLDRKGES